MRRYLMNNKIGKLHINRHCSTCETLTCSILKDCSPGCLDAISVAKECLIYKKGDRIQTAGTKIDGLYLISSGKIKIYKNGKNGEEVIIRFIKAGEILDFFDSSDFTEYLFSARAIDDTIICFLENKAFFNIVSCNPELASSLIKFYFRKVNELQNSYFKMANMNVPAKVADALMNIQRAFGSDEIGTLNLVLSRIEIAGLATTTKEQVSKILSEFISAGIIKKNGKKIVVVDFHKLQNIAEV